MTAAYQVLWILAADPGTDELGFDPHAFKLTLWTFVTFVVVLTILWQFAWGPILEALEQRSQKIKGDIEGAEASRTQAESLKSDYQAKLDHARSEVVAIVEEGKRDALVLKETIVASAREEAASIKARAEREVALSKAEALAEVWGTSASLATELAGKLIGRELSAQDHRALIQDVVSKYQAAAARTS